MSDVLFIVLAYVYAFLGIFIGVIVSRWLSIDGEIKNILIGAFWPITLGMLIVCVLLYIPYIFAIKICEWFNV